MKTGYWRTYLLKTESNTISSLEDFVRNIGIPTAIKRDNSRIQTGTNWTDIERKLCINSIMTEPYYPWQKMVEHTIYDLGTMVKRCMDQYVVPLSQHYWCSR